MHEYYAMKILKTKNKIVKKKNGHKEYWDEA